MIVLLKRRDRHVDASFLLAQAVNSKTAVSSNMQWRSPFQRYPPASGVAYFCFYTGIYSIRVYVSLRVQCKYGLLKIFMKKEKKNKNIVHFMAKIDTR